MTGYRLVSDVSGVTDWFWCLQTGFWCLRTGGGAGFNLQVLADQSGGDRVHRCSMSQKHRNGFFTILFEEKYLPEDRNRENTMKQP